MIELNFQSSDTISNVAPQINENPKDDFQKEIESIKDKEIPSSEFQSISRKDYADPIISSISAVEEELEKIENISEELENNSDTKESMHDNETLETIDERAIYSSSSKQSGVLLEIFGWDWDSFPQPYDITDETGKIVFEIKIDDTGDIVSIITLERTTSAYVESIYKDALAKTTFSKKLDNFTDDTFYNGKVTFIIKNK